MPESKEEHRAHMMSELKRQAAVVIDNMKDVPEDKKAKAAELHIKAVIVLTTLQMAQGISDLASIGFDMVIASLYQTYCVHNGGMEENMIALLDPSLA